MDLHFRKTHGHYVVFNREKDGAHTHIRSHKTCVKLINMLERLILPDSEYLIESARRLLKKHEFDKLRPKRRKQRYYNSNGKKVG